MMARNLARDIAPPARPDPADVQGLVAYGYKFNCSRHFILSVEKRAAALDFIEALAQSGYVTNAALGVAEVKLLKDKGHCPLNIGFSYHGLEKLGLPVPYLYVFREKAAAFTEGACQRAARHLADTGASSSAWWDDRFKEHSADVLVSIHADLPGELDAMCDAVAKLPGAAGLSSWAAPLEAMHLTSDPNFRTTHFGMRDGIANPRICGFHKPDDDPEVILHAAGELLLGYPNDNEFNPWLLINPWPQPNPWLLTAAEIDPRFFRNGSFAALRKIEQDVKQFEAFVAHWAERLLVSREYIAAKMAGRWMNGSLVKPGETESPAKPDPDLDKFDFSKDRNGEGCPFGAHIRRMNPRSDPVVPFRRRPLVRRGMPYGPAYRNDEGAKVERGLLGLFFCASLEDQFEHLLAEWGNANPMGPYNRGNAKDPLMGNHENPRAAYDIPMPDDQLRQLEGFTPFVTTRGTLYAFFPGCIALAMIPELARRKP